VGVTGVEGVRNAEYDIMLVELRVGVCKNGKAVPEADISEGGGEALLFLNRDATRLLHHMTLSWE
jgi:hypothetical protein